MEQISHRRQNVMDNQGITSQQEEINRAIAAEEERRQKMLERQMLLENDLTYKTCKYISVAMDKYCLDPIIGFFFPGVSDTLTQVLVFPFLYAALFKVHSIPLTLAMIYNSLMDILKGTIPIIGDIWDIFNRSYVKNYKLLVGYVEDDKSIINQVHKDALKCLIGIGLLCVAIYFAYRALAFVWQWTISLLMPLWDWIVSII